MPATRPTIESFNERYIPEPNSGCWLWIGGLGAKNYGALTCGGYKGSAHRFSYFYFKGVNLPEGKIVCHSCGNAFCVNPDHLYAGTYKENARDTIKHGRHASQTKPHTFARGERASNAKLNEDQVREIRGLIGTASRTKIGERFNVSYHAIKLIEKNITWRHVS